MTALQRRFKNAIVRIGDGITINSTPKVGVVVLLTRGFAYSLLDGAVVDAAVRPMRLAYVPFDDNSSAGQTAVWDGLTFAVKKVIAVRTQDQTVLKMLALG